MVVEILVECSERFFLEFLTGTLDRELVPGGKLIVSNMPFSIGVVSLTIFRFIMSFLFCKSLLKNLVINYSKITTILKLLYLNTHT